MLLGTLLAQEVPLPAMMRHALPLAWTRDPFDRMIAAHSLARRPPLCSVVRCVRAHHRFLARELRG